MKTAEKVLEKYMDATDYGSLNVELITRAMQEYADQESERRIDGFIEKVCENLNKDETYTLFWSVEKFWKLFDRNGKCFHNFENWLKSLK